MANWNDSGYGHKTHFDIRGFKPCSCCGKPVAAIAPKDKLAQCGRAECDADAKSVKIMHLDGYYHEIELLTKGY